MPIKGLAICAGVIASLFSVQPCFADACQELSKLTLENTVISTAKTIPAGPFEADVPIPGAPKLHYDLPSYCRVTGSIHPTSDSDIRFEAWLPVSGWNGRYQQVGNGGLAGSMPYPGLASTLSRATATAATDDGHVTPQNGFDATWTIGHPEKLKDYGDRAVHLTAKVGQALVRAYYSKPASYNYFIGCSDGGRESLMEAQRYPEDFDGYLVGAPGIDIVNGAITHLYSYKALRALGPAQQLSPTQLEALSMKVLASCDALDGIKDGALRDPRACKFDPKVMICKPGDKPDTCLTAAQADAVRKIYDGPKDAKGAQISHGNMGTLGTEYITWPYIVTDGPEIQTLGGLVSTIVGTLIYGDPKLDPLKIDLAQAARDSAARVAPVMNPDNPDLSRARSLGKKILMFHGWADPNIPPQYSIAYYDAVTKRMGADVSDFYRYFMVPGMPHCGGNLGLGADFVGLSGVLAPPPPQLADADHDWTIALERWVEQGKAPERIIATEFDLPRNAPPPPPSSSPAPIPVKSTRPICLYPKVAVYKGSGAQSDAANFECALK